MLFLLLSISFFIRTVTSLLSVTYYWQLKEYRWDRMKQFITEQGGAQKIMNPFAIFFVVAVISYVLMPFLFPDSLRFFTYYPFVVGVVIFAEALQAGHHAWLKKIKRPRFTSKALLILGLSSLFEFLPLIILMSSDFPLLSLHRAAFFMAFLALLDADIVSLIVIVVNQISEFLKKRLYRRAQEIRLKRKDLRVFGITGSFGKTSVKEFLASLLSQKFSVLKTPLNINTEIGISNLLIHSLRPEHEIMVAEMGAYERGEIKRSCLIARPKIGILTGLNEQHAALFGSLDKTFQAKWELASSLPPDGLLIVNGECDELRDRLRTPSCRMIACFLDEEKSLAVPAETAVATKIEVKESDVSFQYQGARFHAPLLGRFQVQNLLMSIVAAQALGMKLADIARELSSVTPPPKTMVLNAFQDGLIIDDSYNVNPSGLMAALQHLDHFPESLKIIFFPGIIELGEASAAIHEELGAEIGKAVDFAFFTDPHFSEELVHGASRSGLTKERICLETSVEGMQKKLQELFKQNQRKSWVILFESRGAEGVMKELGCKN